MRYLKVLSVLLIALWALHWLAASAGLLPESTSADMAPISSTLAPPAAPVVHSAADRKAFAQAIEQHLLAQGIDAHVTTTGAEARTLRIAWAAMSRPVVANMMSSPGITTQAPALGIQTVLLTDDGSFSHSRVMTWTYHWDGAGWQ